MAYFSISDFKYGMDRRRPQDSGIPGTLWTLKNAYISRGGDILRAKKFASTYSLPTGTFGLASISNQLFVFGSASTPSGVPVGVQYQQLAHPSSGTMVKLIDAKPFDGAFYAIAEFDDGSLYHYYDGSRVSTWDALADAAFTYSTVAARLADKLNSDPAVSAAAYGAVIRITALTAGTAFTLATSTTDGSGSAGSLPTAATAAVQANVAAVAEVQATGTVTITGGSSSAGVNTISSVTVDGVELLSVAVDWITSNDATANALVVEVNNNTSTHNYTASAVGAVVTLTAAPGTGTSVNGDVVSSTTTGDVTTSDANIGSGVDAVTAVAQVSTVTIDATTSDSTDTWTVTINGTDYLTTGLASGMGTSCIVHKNRVWATANSLLRYCVLNDPTDWSTTATPASDAGFINMGSQAEGAQQLVGLGIYNGRMAIFARTVILIYTMSADATEIAIEQTVENTGTMAFRSIVSYGANDLFYLDDTGIRSLRPRSGYNEAYSSDVGNAFDPYMQELMAAVSSAELADASAVIEGVDGRLFLKLKQQIVMFSSFPGSKISAWSFYDQEADIDNIARSFRDIYIRSGDTIYKYGGADGTTYPDDDEFEVTVTTPFVTAQDAATFKNATGFDIAALNDWAVTLLTDPNNPDDATKEIDVGILTGNTYNKFSHKTIGSEGVFAFKFVCSNAGDAKLSSIAFHYEDEETE